MPQISFGPPPRPLENPSQTEWGKNAGTLGLLLMGGIYAGVAPLNDQTLRLEGRRKLKKQMQQAFTSTFFLIPYPQGTSSEHLIPFDGEHCAWLKGENEEKLLQALKEFFVP